MLRRLSLLTLALLLTFSLGAPAGAAKPRPFKGRVTATWDNIFLGLTPGGATFEGGGPITHMGRTTQQGTLFLEPLAPDFSAPGGGSVTITAANGDQLSFDYEGILFALSGEGIGTFTVTGGTGRFADATGSGAFYALIDLSLPENQPMFVILDGEIDY
jgi:hypothetical protein